MAATAQTVSALARVAYRLQLLSALLALLDGALWISGDVDASACALGDPSAGGARGGSFYCVKARLPLAVSTLAAVAMMINGWIGLKLAAGMREAVAAAADPTEVAGR
ncbi:unnamed protein product [Ostreobium quekettii]|uniref:CASP-like protein n=1 Tax=Ostreobium quekettii TaxID=121088 RepID=A0A8S1IXP1_9CHLO|nr:unnamed protein product [Ostreobium quekettii]